MKRQLRLILILLLGVVASTNLYAQSQSRVSLRVVDSSTSEPVLGATIELFVKGQTTNSTHQTSTDYRGRASMVGVALGEYTLKVSLIGYHSNSVDYNINKAPFDMGDVPLTVDVQSIEQINFAATAIRTSQRGDTLAYNADAFKVTRDADAEALLSKMPGITVSDGVVEAQGEEVQKVLIDGRELFGSDVSTAIKNIPAEAIKEVEVFDKKSDQAEFSGVDDGDDYKAINIVTRPGMSNGLFGKFYGSYVYDDKYNVGASINMFQGERKLSVIAMSNNVNQQSFSTDDLLGAVSSNSGRGRRSGSSMTSAQSGVSTTNALSINYSEKYSETITATASYAFTSSDNVLEEYTERWYTLSADSLQNYNSEYYSNSNNYNHRLEAKLDWNINDNNMLMFRPNLSFQSYDSSNETFGENYISTDGTSALLNSIEEISSQDRFGYNISNTIVYRHKFNDKGRNMTLYATGSISKNESDLLSDSYTKYMTATESDDDDDLDLNTISDAMSYSIRANASYVEPLSSKLYLVANYRYNKSYSDNDKRAYMYDPITGGYTDFSSTLSNTYTSDYTTQTIGPSIRYNTRMTSAVLDLSYQKADLKGEQTYPEIEQPITDTSFEDFTYMGMLRHQFTNQTSIRMQLRGSTSNPSVTQLQDVVDISNPLFVSSGNPDLVPTYTHSGNVSFIHSNIRRGSTLMLMLDGSLQNNYIGSDVTIAEESMTVNGVELSQGAQYTKPVNLDGYMTLRANMDLGFPVSFIRSNLNLKFGASYSELPSIINSATNMTETMAYSAGAVVGSNISEYVDFTLSYNGSYNVAKNTIQTSSDNTYLSQSAALRMKIEAWWGLTLSIDGSYNQYKGITDSYNEQYTLIGAALGKKIFYNQRGEISIGVSDLLDQNTSFVRNVTDTYIENVTSNVLGRMFNIKFTYNLRTYLK